MLQAAWWGGHSTGGQGQGISQFSRATGEIKRGRISMSLPPGWETVSLPGRAISGQCRGDYPGNMTLTRVQRVKKCEARTWAALLRGEGRSLRISEEVGGAGRQRFQGFTAGSCDHCSYDPWLFSVSPELRGPGKTQVMLGNESIRLGGLCSLYALMEDAIWFWFFAQHKGSQGNTLKRKTELIFEWKNKYFINTKIICHSIKCWQETCHGRW